MKTDYDVIIAGGGIAGVLTATSIAINSKEKLKILIIDINKKEELGKKTVNGWICGDATSKNSIKFIEENLNIIYDEPELAHKVKGVLAYSPDHKTSVLFEGDGYVINRKILPQKQMNEALKQGVEFKFNTRVESLIEENGYITGVEARELDTNKVFTNTSKIVVDSTGSASRLRENLAIETKIQKTIDKNDMESTGRYIYEFKYGEEDKTFFDKDYCLIHLDQYLAPGGYSWVFPKEKGKVNIGLGVQKRALENRNKKYDKNDNLIGLIGQYVKMNPVITNPILSTDENDMGNLEGTWQVPVRRHNDCLVANGYAIVGDAAWMPRPIDAGGIGPAIYGSVILGKVIATAIKNKNYSEKSLWKYNVEYMNTYGYNMASFEILRKYLQTLTNDEISYGMKNFLSQEDIDDITRRQHPKFNKVKIFNPIMLIKILTHTKLASGLKYTSSKSSKLIKHNLNYPTNPEDFEKWQKELLNEINEADIRFNLKN